MNALISLFAVSMMIFITPMTGSEKTIQNLKDAYIGESTASSKYAAFALQARQEGFTKVAALFEAASRSEAIHASNHKSALEKLGSKPEPLKLPEIKPKSTLENLEEAYKGESYEINNMYPGFIKISRADGATAATKSFNWAVDTEKKHMLFYSTSIDALKANNEKSLPGIYWVCPKCGNTYNTPTPEKSCTLCMTPGSKFIKFGK